MMYTVTTFYKFVATNPEELKVELTKVCKQNNILGTILVAKEGINSTVFGKDEDVKALQAYFASRADFADMEFKDSYCDFPPFHKLKVKIKSEIIKFDESIDAEKDTGEHLSAKEWERLIDSGAMIIDTRNDYEIAFGTYKNSVNPKTRNFTDFIDWAKTKLKNADKSAPIGMCCTGGVRCEKSTAFLKSLGFQHVYHLQGGIIKYFMEAEKPEEYWQGSCFVFDDRIALKPDLQPLYKPQN